jgi:hypothetical protein
MLGLRVAGERLWFPSHRTIKLCERWATPGVRREKGSGCVGGRMASGFLRLRSGQALRLRPSPGSAQDVKR